jgi:hypothetical protein
MLLWALSCSRSWTASSLPAQSYAHPPCTSCRHCLGYKQQQMQEQVGTGSKQVRLCNRSQVLLFLLQWTQQEEGTRRIWGRSRLLAV